MALRPIVQWRSLYSNLQPPAATLIRTTLDPPAAFSFRRQPFVVFTTSFCPLLLFARSLPSYMRCKRV